MTTKTLHPSHYINFRRAVMLHLWQRYLRNLPPWTYMGAFWSKHDHGMLERTLNVQRAPPISISEPLILPATTLWTSGPWGRGDSRPEKHSDSTEKRSLRQPQLVVIFAKNVHEASHATTTIMRFKRTTTHWTSCDLGYDRTSVVPIRSDHCRQKEQRSCLQKFGGRAAVEPPGSRSWSGPRPSHRCLHRRCQCSQRQRVWRPASPAFLLNLRCEYKQFWKNKLWRCWR